MHLDLAAIYLGCPCQYFPTVPTLQGFTAHLPVVLPALNPLMITLTPAIPTLPYKLALFPYFLLFIALITFF